MPFWPTTLRIDKDLKLLVTSPEGDDLIKARLPQGGLTGRTIRASHAGCRRTGRLI